MPSLMRTEALQTAEVVSHMLSQDADRYAAWSAQMVEATPRQVITVARGSSDHAASYLAYLLALETGTVVASLPLSLVSLHQRRLDVQNCLAIAISQSGRSPDLLATMQALSSQGACTTALVNDATSPLAAQAQWSFPLHAGAERSVAATKSYIASLVASVRLVGYWSRALGASDHLLQGLQQLPQALQLATQVDWSRSVETLLGARSAMVLGRGLGFAVAQEAALKLKETSCLQAEAFSGAEVLHGPMALVGHGYPLIIFALPGPTLAGQLQLAREMRQRGAKVMLVATDDVAEVDLRIPAAPHEALSPILAIQCFYLLAEQLARARGLNPDRPNHLQKVTLTL